MRASRWSAAVAVLATILMAWVGLPATASPLAAGVAESAAAAPAAVLPAARAKAVTAGFVHSCALTTTGGVRCWGYGADGELGSGSKTTSVTPVAVVGLGKGVRTISSGSYFTCALTAAGAVRCWGSNTYGQLGDNTKTDSATPVPVYGLGKGVKAISTGNYFACALTLKGAVRCWGANNYGQLGNGTTTSSAKPLPVSGLTAGVRTLGLGGYHGCAVTKKRGVKCWGYNAEGQLGDNSKVDSTTPVPVYGMSSGAKAVAAGSYSTCALSLKGVVRCWGYNGDGELGTGTTTRSLKPVRSVGLTKKVRAIGYGDIHGCAVTRARHVKCWGYNGYGALGDNSTTSSPKPVGVYALSALIRTVAAGGYHTCAATMKGRVYCWGFNSYGELGDGTTTVSRKPVAVVGLS